MDHFDEKTKQNLDACYTWPTSYTFKFIVPKNKENSLLELVKDSLQEVSRRPSSSGKYTAFTFQGKMSSANEVIATYKRVKQIEGLVSL